MMLRCLQFPNWRSWDVFILDSCEPATPALGRWLHSCFLLGLNLYCRTSLTPTWATWDLVSRLLCMCAWTHACTCMYVHTHTHYLTHTLTTFTHTVTHTLSHTLSCTDSHTHSLSHTQSHILSHTYTLTHTHSHMQLHRPSGCVFREVNCFLRTIQTAAAGAGVPAQVCWRPVWSLVFHHDTPLLVCWPHYQQHCWFWPLSLVRRSTWEVH